MRRECVEARSRRIPSLRGWFINPVMLYLITGYLTEHRDGEPVVIYCGHDAERCGASIDAADSKYQRVEKAMVTSSFKVRGPVTPAASPVVAPVAASEKPVVETEESAPAASEEPASEEPAAVADDAPAPSESESEISPSPKPSKRSRS